MFELFEMKVFSSGMRNNDKVEETILSEMAKGKLDEVLQ
jgi:hypothetical protein